MNEQISADTSIIIIGIFEIILLTDPGFSCSVLIKSVEKTITNNVVVIKEVIALNIFIHF